MLNLKLDEIDISSKEEPSLSSLSSASATLLNTSEINFIVKSFVMSGNQTGIKCPSEYVKLNIGGSLHYTTISTLRKHDTMLRAMFSGRMEVLTDSEGKKN